MNKKLIGIIGIICVISIIVVVCIFVKKQNTEPTETGAFHKMTITIKDYTLDINSKEVGHPSNGSYFNTSFNIVGNDKSTRTYFVDYVDIKLVTDNLVDNEIIEEAAEQGNVTINGKKFNYLIDKSRYKAVLYYKISNENEQLIISLKGGNIFSADGAQAKTMASITEDVLNSKELAGILNFSISK